MSWTGETTRKKEEGVEESADELDAESLSRVCRDVLSFNRAGGLIFGVIFLEKSLHSLFNIQPPGNNVRQIK